MIRQFIFGKTSVFIDASNVYHSLKSVKFQIDYKSLLNYLKKEVDLVDVYFYSGVVNKNEKQRKFFDKLEILGYKVRKKEIKRIEDRETGRILYKGNLDVELVIDAIDTIWEYRNFILFSGDSDFADLLRYLKDKRRRVLVISAKKHVARELLLEAKFIDLKKLQSEIELKKYPPEAGR